MAEPVLPAAATVVGFTLASISWYAMLRAAIQQVYDDTKAFNRWEEDVRKIRDNLDRLQVSLGEWQNKWMVWDLNLPESLYLEFWGEEYRCKILERLKAINEDMEKAERVLRASKKRKGIKRVVYGLTFVLMRKDYLENLLERLEKENGYINTMANRAWHTRNPSESDTVDVDFRRVQYIGICHLLVPLAVERQKNFVGLTQYFLDARRTLVAEVELDIFSSNGKHAKQEQGTHPEQGKEREQGGHQDEGSDFQYSWAKAVAESAAISDIRLKVLAQKASVGNTNLLERLHICKSWKPREEALQSANAAFDSVIANGGEAHFYATWVNNRFCVSKSQHPADPHERNEGERSSLRVLLSQVPGPLNRRPDLLGRVSKYKIVSELSQACFLFLQCAWMRRLCSCCLQCGKLPNSPKDYSKEDFEGALAISNVEDHDQRFSNSEEPHLVWCRNEMNWDDLTAPFRRLGILLLEITLGATVLNIEVDLNGTIKKVSMRGNDPDLGTAEYTLPDLETLIIGQTPEEEERGERPRSRKYAKAITYCLKVQPETSRYVTEEEIHLILTNFYWSVVVEMKEFHRKVQLQYHTKQREVNSGAV